MLVLALMLHVWCSPSPQPGMLAAWVLLILKLVLALMLLLLLLACVLLRLVSLLLLPCKHPSRWLLLRS